MSLSLYDSRPFFEKALQYGVQHGLLDQAKLDAICADAPKGMVQIARYLGNENLRPDIELAKNRIVNLVGLHLEHASHGDLHTAAQLLRDHSFLSRSKAGSDMLKALIVMPQNTHFAMSERAEFSDEHIPLLAKWSLRPLADYMTEFATRSQVAKVVDAALWLADFYGLDDEALVEAGTDAEAVIRTSLLALTYKAKQLPDWTAFERLIERLRNHVAQHGTMPALVLPKNLPSDYWPVLDSVHASVLTDLPKLWDANLPIRKLFLQTPAFIGRYFWQENPLGDMDSYEREVDDKHAARMQQSSETWQTVTQGHSDDATLLTVLLCVASDTKPSALLTERDSKTIIRKIRKAVLQGEAGLDSAKVNHYLEEHAPPAYQAAFAQLWLEFLHDALPTLKSDFDYDMHDALAHLRLHCHIK
ncbi:MAG TPA: hypothetical protein PKC80_03540 [Burkholderiaceae bacterium]|nr:hypothetical protein [Burkholderiaceae bacterium]